MEIKLVIILVFLALTTAVSSQATDYCSFSSCNHTLCIFPSARQGASCQSPLGSGLTEDQKTQILNLHNEFRQKVASGQETRGSPGPQPAAASMPNLTWNDELATIAQRWADQCTFGHDSCRRTSTSDYAGQNVAQAGTSEDVNSITMDSLIKMFTNEVQYFNKDQVTSFNGNGGVGGEIGHYTQVVWATTTAIGCGASKYSESGFNNFYLVCNYGPGGNYQGAQIYQPA